MTIPLTRILPPALVLFAALAWTLPAPAQFLPPEGETPKALKPLVTAERHIIATANPLASQAGLEILRAGGSAVDAAIAAQLVLGLVEPQSSGLGGGAVALVAGPDGRVSSYDGRETAPAGAAPDRFMGPDGKPLTYQMAFPAARAVGTPGLVAMLGLLHERHGQLPWADLFAPAIRLAEEGFPTQPRMAAALAKPPAWLATGTDLTALFDPEGDGFPKVGETFRNPAYAQTLRMLAEAGPGAFYAGANAQALVDRLAQAAGPDGPATVTLADLAAYRPLERQAVCLPYRVVWRVCGMGPPSSGGVGVLQGLAMLEAFPLPDMGPGDAQAWHLIAEVERRVYADRARWIGDPDVVSVPTDGLLDRRYLADRAAGVDPASAAKGPVPPGDPPRRQGHWADGAGPDLPGTSHLSVLDKDGLMVAFTTTIESAFGSGYAVGGYLLNNQLTDFTFTPEVEGRPVLNAVAGGKRPRSSMSPTLVFDPSGRPVLSVGSPGGSAIIGYVLQTVVAVLDWKLDPQAAIDLPRVLNLNGRTVVEAGAEADWIAKALERRGHEVVRRPLTSGIQAIQVTPDGTLRGAADPRRDGAALGD